MPKTQDVNEFFAKAKAIFLEKNKRRGTTLTFDQAKSLAQVKLDRIKDDPSDTDSYVDLANYGLIMWLQRLDLWQSADPTLEDAAKPVVEEDGMFMRTVKLVKKIQVKLATAFVGITEPKKAGDVGYDLAASEDFSVPAVGQSFPANVPCGISMKIPEGYWAEIRPRSSTATKLGILVYQSVMDEGYVGPWFVVCHSVIGAPVNVPKGTRLAQCIFHKSNVMPIEFVDSLPETERGAAGFGSTGLK